MTGSGLTAKTLPTLTTHPMFGLLAQPKSYGRESVGRFPRWAADNGCFTLGDRFNEPRWMAWLRDLAPLAPSCAFATAPDVVGDPWATWARSAPLIAPIRALGYKAALVAQDGLDEASAPWQEFDVLFLGGSTEWKLSDHARRLTAAAKQRGMWVHMGRVNSLRRLQLAEDFGCDSVDGTFLGFAPDTNLPRMMRWLDGFRSKEILV